MYLQRSAAEIWSCSMCSILHGYRSKFYPKKTHVVNSISPLPTLPVGGTIKKKGVYITPVYHSFTSIYFDDFPIKTSIYRGLTMTTPSFFQPTATPPNQPRHPNCAVKNCRPAASQSMRWACTLPLATAHWATRPTPTTGR